METIEFETQVGRKDMFRFLMKHFYTRFSGIFGVVLSLGALVVFIQGIGKREPYQLGILLVMASLFTIVQPLQLWQKASMQIKHNPVFQKPLQYQINKEGITVSQEGEKTTLPWENVRRIVETKTMFLVYMSSINASIIPKEQMKDNETKFREIVKASMEKRAYRLKG